MHKHVKSLHPFWDITLQTGHDNRLGQSSLRNKSLQVRGVLRLQSVQTADNDTVGIGKTL